MTISRVGSSNKEKTIAGAFYKYCATSFQIDVKIVPSYTVPSVRLVPYLELHHSATFLDNICLVKLDTEGHDVIILQDLVHTTLRPPVIWTEWYALYRFSGKDEDGDWMEEVTIKCFTEIHDIVFSA